MSNQTNKLTSIFIKEGYPYSKDNLFQLFNCKHAIEIIKELKQYGIIKTSKIKNDINNVDFSDSEQIITSVDDNDTSIKYIFNYVGIIIIQNTIIKILPKYIKIDTYKLNNLTVEEEKELTKKLKQIIKVLEKYNNSKTPVVNMYNNNLDNGSVNLLAVMLYLLNDYYEYGIYNNQVELIEMNGNSEILWDKTINETFAIIKNNRPIYTELFTKKKSYNEFDYFKRLHEYVLTQCSNYIKETKLDDLFDNILPVNLSEETQLDFGDEDYILYRINQELNIQFNTRKQLVLKLIYSFISQNKIAVKGKCLNLYGTNSFNLVWEEVCRTILNDKLNKSLKNCIENLHSQYNEKSNKTLKELIEKPRWNKFEANETLEPDIISIKNNCFTIYDAKYYNLKIDGSLSGQPGIESITKQYFYQLAFKDFIEKHNLKTRNIFLFPTDGNKLINAGFVKMSMFENLGLVDIAIIYLPCEEVFSYYLMEQNYLLIDNILNDLQ